MWASINNCELCLSQVPHFNLIRQINIQIFKAGGKRRPCVWVVIATNASGLSLFSICDWCLTRPHISWRWRWTRRRWTRRRLGAACHCLAFALAARHALISCLYASTTQYHAMPRSYLAFILRTRHRCPVTSPTPCISHTLCSGFSFKAPFLLSNCTSMCLSSQICVWMLHVPTHKVSICSLLRSLGKSKVFGEN